MRTIPLCCLALLFLLPACGCRKQGHPPAALNIELGYDPTPPDADERARQASAAMPSFPRQDVFTLRATDHKTTIISTAIPEDDTAAYKILQSISTRVVPVTDLATYFETVAAAAESSSRPTIILLYTDGLDDGDRVTATARIEAAAHRLAANPRVRAVILVGLVRDIRPHWKGLPEMLDCIDQGQEKRLCVQPQSGMDPEALARSIDKVRAETPKSGTVR